MKKNFVLGYYFGCFLFFLTSEPNLNLPKMEEFDLGLLKNEIIILNKNIFTNTYESSIYNVTEVGVKHQTPPSLPRDIKTKPKKGGNSIFVEAFQSIRTFPARPNFNSYDRVENQFVKHLVVHD